VRWILPRRINRTATGGAFLLLVWRLWGG